MSEITQEQINRCLFNGNNKLGKMSGGWHKVADAKAKGYKLPEKLPEQAQGFFLCNGNVAGYVAGGVFYTNTDATAHLSEIQKACVALLAEQAQGKGKKLANCQLGWQGASGGKATTVAEKVAGLF